MATCADTIKALAARSRRAEAEAERLRTALEEIAGEAHPLRMRDIADAALRYRPDTPPKEAT